MHKRLKEKNIYRNSVNAQEKTYYGTKKKQYFVKQVQNIFLWRVIKRILQTIWMDEG